MGIGQGMSWQLDGFDDDALSEVEDDAGSALDADEESGGGDGLCDRGIEEDDGLDVTGENESKQTSMMSTNLTIINTNTRSLCPKITSQIDCSDELQGTVAVITETWLANGEPLDADIVDLAHGAGLGLIHRNRAPNVRGVAHGGVAVVYRRSACNMTKIDMSNPDKLRC